jgi:rhomboid family GlyGly-CTERM serine protease
MPLVAPWTNPVVMMDPRRAQWFRSLNCDMGHDWALPAALAVPALLACGGERWRSWLQYDRAGLAAGQWWRLLSGHLVHLSLPHLLLNLAGMVLLWMLFAREYSTRQWLIIVALSIAAIDAGLWWLQPTVLWYVGASGVLHGVWAAGAWAQITGGRPTARATLGSAAPMLLLLAKLIYEHVSSRSALIGSIPVVLVAHAYGAAGGVLWPLLGQRPRPGDGYNRGPNCPD